MGEFIYLSKPNPDYNYVQDQAFLWRHENLFIMDNHRAAIWCWEQLLPTESAFSVLHVDAHYDMLPFPPEWLDGFPDLSNIAFENFLELPNPIEPEAYKLFLHSNYIAPFLLRRKAGWCSVFSATHEIEDHRPREADGLTELGPADLTALTPKKLLGLSRGPWILNIDLDYFYTRNYDDDTPSRYHRKSDIPLEPCLNVLSKLSTMPEVIVTTVALSPVYCGGWMNAIELCRHYVELLQLDLDLSQIEQYASVPL